MQGFCGKTEGNRPLGYMYVNERIILKWILEEQAGKLMHLAQDRAQLVNTAMSPRVR
jgi:hypothetical protein